MYHTQLSILSCTYKIRISQESSAEVLCSGIVAVVQEKCPELLPAAKEVHTRFTTELSLFEKCHRVYNGGVTDDTTIDQLCM